MRYIICRIGGLRGLAQGLLEGALLFGGMGIWLAVLFAVAPIR